MPSSLEGVLAGIPGLAGYNAQSQFNQQRGLGDLQMASGAVGLMGHLTALQRDAAMRNELAVSDGSQESLARIAAKYAGAGDIMKSQTDSLDRKAALISALTTKAQMHKDKMDLAYMQLAGVTDERARKAYETQLHAANLSFEQQLKRDQVAAGLPPDTVLPIPNIRMSGTVSAPFMPGAQPPSAILGMPSNVAPQQLGGNTTIAPTVSPAEVMSIQDPQERAQAMAALQGGRFAAQTPAAAVPAQPQPAPQAPVAPNLGMGGNMDMRDMMMRRAAQRGQPTASTEVPSVVEQIPLVGTPAPLTPTAPMQPKQLTLADAPPDLSLKDKAKWLLQQTRNANAAQGINYADLPEHQKDVLDSYAWGYINTRKLEPRRRLAASGTAFSDDQIVARAVEIARTLGLSISELAARPAAFKADASALAKQTMMRDSMVSIMESFHNNINTWDNIAKGLPPAIRTARVDEFVKDMQKVNFIGIQSLDELKLAIQRQFNDPSVAAYLIATMAVQMDYARIIGGGGLGSVAMVAEGARKDAERLIRAGMNDESRKGAIASLESDAMGQVRGRDTSINNIRKRMGLQAVPVTQTSGSSSAPAMPTAAPVGNRSAIDAALEKYK